MRTRSFTNPLLQIAIASLILSGCASPTSALQEPTKQPTTLTSTVTPVMVSTVSTPLPTLPYYPTPVPTQSYNQEVQLAALLQAKDCTLPCYLGITPGKTSLSEAEMILKNIGGYYRGNLMRQDGSIDYAYGLDLEDPPGIDEALKPSGNVSVVFALIDLITIGDTVQGLEVDAGTAKGSDYEIFAPLAMAKFRQLWSRYSSTNEIFLQMRDPDHLYIDTVDSRYVFYGRTLLFDYESHYNSIIELYGTGQENNICTRNQARFIDLYMRLYNPNSGLSVYSAGGVRATDRSVWLPIEEVLGVTTEEFYNRVVSNPSTCFKPKETIP